MDYIQLKKNDILRIGIKDAEGNDTGNVLEFDLEDIELLFKLQEMVDKDLKNRLDNQNRMKILSKKQDYHKKNKILSYKEEEEMKIMKDFFKKETEIYNIFLGENGVQKILNGRKLNWGILDEIDEIINEHIYPKLKLQENNIKDKIMKKYGKKVDDVIE